MWQNLFVDDCQCHNITQLKKINHCLLWVPFLENCLYQSTATILFCVKFRQNVKCESDFTHFQNTILISNLFTCSHDIYECCHISKLNNFNSKLNYQFKNMKN